MQVQVIRLMSYNTSGTGIASCVTLLLVHQTKSGTVLVVIVTRLLWPCYVSPCEIYLGVPCAALF